MRESIYIYYYEYPVDSKRVYVGSTYDIRIRKNSHQTTKNIKVTLHELDSCGVNERGYWENFYVELLKSWGFKILNKHKIRANINWDDKCKYIGEYGQGVLYSKGAIDLFLYEQINDSNINYINYLRYKIKNICNNLIDKKYEEQEKKKRA